MDQLAKAVFEGCFACSGGVMLTHQTKESGAAHLMGRRQRPWGISVVTSSHMTTPKLKMSALELQGKPSRTCTRQQMPMSPCTTVESSLYV